MDRDRWRKLLLLYDTVLEAPVERREAQIAALCGDDDALCRELRSLLSADDPDFLATPLAALSVPLGHAADAGPDPGDEHVDALAGHRFGPYRVLRHLASGGMGRVYLAERTEGGFTQQVALKLLPPGASEPGLLRRFMRERAILAALDHPYICALVDGGVSEDGRPWFAMPFIEGARRITQYCDEEDLDIAARVALMRRVCEAVHYAHQNLVVHADLKPDNILIDAQGRPRLVDFGIARLLRPGLGVTRTMQTRDARRPLTPEYASPEQLRGAPPTTATDVYALGVVLYRLLAGRPPYRFATGNADEIAELVASVDPPPASEAARAAGLPARRRPDRDLDNIVRRAMAKAPDARYASAAALAADLGRWQAGLPVEARPPSRRDQLRKFVRRHTAAVVAGSLALLLLVAFAATMTISARRIAAQAGQIAAERDRARAVADFLGDTLAEADPEISAEAVAVRELLARAAARLQRDAEIGAEERASILGVLASAYFSLGDFEAAQRLAEAAVAPWRAGAPADPAWLKGAQTLADIAIRLQDAPAALAATADLQRLTDALPHARPAERTAALNARALAHQLAGQRDAAIAMLEQAIAINREDGGNPEALAVELSNLAHNLFQRSQERAGSARAADLAQAQALIDESLALLRAVLGPRHARIAVTLNARAMLEQARGDLAAAEATLLEAADLARDVYGTDHPFVAHLGKNLGRLYLEGGRPAEAVAVLVPAQAIVKASYPEGHPAHARYADLLARARSEAGPPAGNTGSMDAARTPSP